MTTLAVDYVTEMVAVHLIVAGSNDRKMFSDQALRQLAASIDEHGIAQPPTLRRLPDGRFEIVAGERRVRAMRDILGWSEVPAMVREMTDDQASDVMLLENVQRVDLDPFEEARGYAVRMSGRELTVIQVAKLAAVPESRVRRRLRLVSVCDEMAAAVRAGDLPVTWCETASTLDHDRQRSALRAYTTTPNLTEPAWRALVGRFQEAQDQDSMFSLDALTVETWTAEAIEGATVVPMSETREQMLGLAEIAELLGRPRSTVYKWQARHQLPDPDQTVSGMAIWYQSTIVEWARETKRLPADMI